ncbi:hypothetical protein LEP1GSC115_0136 [Leptospira interrogans serovar Australis str. 200703203]|uniref:Uncharacterized protein n=1 Tax=Leptospira interrogans serovar Australis str. 200703203 TaxID=1085541 RepID=N1UNB3_LEPIR|nr:hypothetical protein LEP1GSC115_0136 [Leptospira interrogans serovar Australis str. 200703203]
MSQYLNLKTVPLLILVFSLSLLFFSILPTLLFLKILLYLVFLFGRYV